MKSSNATSRKVNGHTNHIKVETNNGSINPLSPTSPARPSTSSSRKGWATVDSYGNSPISPSVEDRAEGRSGAKRACNECRQQKLRCDVQQDPYVACTRCRKTKIECRIDANFRRVGKRKRNAEMEQELEQLRKKLAEHESANASSTLQNREDSGTPSRIQDHPDSHDAIVSLMDMRRGSAGLKENRARKLEDVLLSGDQLQDIFEIFFKYYRPYQPLIDPDRPPNWYYEASPLLFWAVVSIGARHYEADPSLLTQLKQPLCRLLWSTVAEVPQNFYVVKALCLLCVWPLPVSSTSADMTMMLVGLMMQIARQIGLHRPSQAQDFSKFKVELIEEELRDRVKTWAACNVIAQRVGTGYGQPALSTYDWTLATINGPGDEARPEGYSLPQEMNARLRIEQYVNRVTDALYNNSSDPVGLAPEQGKSCLVSVLAKSLEDLKKSFKDLAETSDMNLLYIRAAALHLRLTVFFDSTSASDYDQSLHQLWLVIVEFVEHAIALKSDDGDLIIKYTTNYIQQMLTAAGFALLKLLNSPFAQHIDFNYGQTLFGRVIDTIRLISVSSHDLSCRLAEVLHQLWKAGDVGKKGIGNVPETLDYSLQLKVRCRMSMSLIFDSVWRWREEFKGEGYAKLEAALDNPTKPGLAQVESSMITSSAQTPSLTAASTSAPLTFSRATTMDTTLAPSLAPAPFAVSRSSSPAFLLNTFTSEWENEVWDPISWTLDGHVGLPYPLGLGPSGGGSLSDFDNGNLLGL